MKLKRDMNLIREILESISRYGQLGPEVQLERDLIQGHVTLAMDAGFVVRTYDGFTLTWSGHDLLESLQQENLARAVSDTLRTLPEGVLSATEIVAGKSYVLSTSHLMGEGARKKFLDALVEEFPNSKFLVIEPDVILREKC